MVNEPAGFAPDSSGPSEPPRQPDPSEVEVPPSETRKQCPGHESGVGTVTHAVYPDDCIRDGFETDPADEPYDPELRPR